jgi:hypothetical protein
MSSPLLNKAYFSLFEGLYSEQELGEIESDPPVLPSFLSSFLSAFLPS